MVGGEGWDFKVDNAQTSALWNVVWYDCSPGTPQLRMGPLRWNYNYSGIPPSPIPPPPSSLPARSKTWNGINTGLNAIALILIWHVAPEREHPAAPNVLQWPPFARSVVQLLATVVVSTFQDHYSGQLPLGILRSWCVEMTIMWCHLPPPTLCKTIIWTFFYN